jgi:hypothetical protein
VLIKQIDPSVRVEVYPSAVRLDPKMTWRVPEKDHVLGTNTDLPGRILRIVFAVEECEQAEQREGRGGEGGGEGGAKRAGVWDGGGGRLGIGELVVRLVVISGLG